MQRNVIVLTILLLFWIQTKFSFFFENRNNISVMIKFEKELKYIYISVQPRSNTYIYIYVTVILRNQIFPGNLNPFRESGESLKLISIESNITEPNLTWNNWSPISEIQGNYSLESMKYTSSYSRLG